MHTILIFATFWISPALWRFFVIFAKIATLHEAWPFFAIWTKFVIFPIQICHFRQNHHSPTGLFWHPNGIASPLAIFCHFPKITIIAKIATLQGATFGFQMDSAALWRGFAIFAIACVLATQVIL